MDQNIIESFMQPGHLVLFCATVVLLAGGFLFIFPLLFERALTKATNNGWGKALVIMFELAITKANDAQNDKFEEALRRRDVIADEKLARALALSDSKLSAAFNAHEEVEDVKLRMVIQETKTEERACSQRVLDKLDYHDKRLTEAEQHLARLLASSRG